ncbi:MAG: rubredoxin [Bacilli bacterium]
MKKFECTICGYIYDEEKGIPEKGIAAGTKWTDLPDDWKCPLCGAPKSMFKEINNDVKENKSVNEENEPVDQLRELSYGELGAICSNLAKGCEKQYLNQESKLYDELSDYFFNKGNQSSSKDYKDLINKINLDLEKEYPIIKKLCLENNDRATLRAITWGEKSTQILKALIERFKNEGSTFLKNTNVYVCDICGFIYIGDNCPDICPICKVPSLKIFQIKEDK